MQRWQREQISVARGDDTVSKTSCMLAKATKLKAKAQQANLLLDVGFSTIAEDIDLEGKPRSERPTKLDHEDVIATLESVTVAVIYENTALEVD
ncbi:hypothetical protein KIN20_028914 [Parelaphostrongylus tenuis]|uniref:Uncharacterized protein n=1 Tax=Parelaphostrongylus tenuis TaxID=148309 RepID=A0AAD5R1W6_PARTN|nr:hypothetical protein KIN20_028914 [Parelaphostrongylus tenuis]